MVSIVYIWVNMDGGEHSEADKPSNAESDPVKSSDELFNDFYSEVN